MSAKSKGGGDDWGMIVLGLIIVLGAIWLFGGSCSGCNGCGNAHASEIADSISMGFDSLWRWFTKVIVKYGIPLIILFVAIILGRKAFGRR